MRPCESSGLKALAVTWCCLLILDCGGSSGSSWVKSGSGGALVDLNPCLTLLILPIRVGIDCSRCLWISGDDRPGQVMNHNVSIASQNVPSSGQPAAAWRKVASFFALV